MKQSLALVALVVLTACQGSKKESPPKEKAATAPADAAPIDANVDACRAAAQRLPTLPRTQRIVALLQGCAPCGDWGALLGWSIPERDGGPSRASIERGMLACNAFCDPNAKQRFFGALDNARGQKSRAPWRFLGDICKDQVSAVPDTRYMGAPYFALDRVARMIGDAAVLGAIELPLPALSISGVGVDLPTSPMTVPDAGPTALTVDASQFWLGVLPTARLSATGVQVSGEYPGEEVEPAALAAELAKPERAHPVALLAPREIRATRILEAITAAGGHDIRLAVGDLELLGWTIPVTVPITLLARAPGRPGMRFALDATGFDALKAAKAAPREQLLRAPVTIALDEAATATGLANLLGTLGYAEVKSVVLVRTAGKAKPAQPAKP